MIWKRSPKKTRLIVRIITSLALLIAVFLFVDVSKTLQFFRNLGAFPIFALLLFSIIMNAISTLKWKIFLKSLNVSFSFIRLFNLYLIGKFFNQFLPSKIGGDAVRLILTFSEERDLSASFTALFMERFIGLVALLILGFISIILSAQYYHLKVNLTFVLSFSLIAILLIIFLFFLSLNFLSKRSFTNKYLSKIQAGIIQVLEKIKIVKDSKGTLAYTFLLSFLFYLAAIINLYIAAWALDISTSFYALAVFVPIILLIANIPLSINGIGIAEGAYVLCLTQAGISPPAALSVALLIRAKNLFFNGFVGGSLFLLYKKDERTFHRSLLASRKRVQ